MLLSGELLQVFGRDRYQAAVHRVVRPAGATEPRVSTPLLVRGASGVVIRDSMLPPAVTARFKEHSKEARRVDGLRETEAATSTTSSSSDEGERKGRLTMTDLWRALQFRGGALSDEDCGGGIGSGEVGGLEGFGGGVVGEDSSSPSPSPSPPLAEAQTEEQIRRCFEPFARGGVTVLSVDPLLVRLHGFASSEECALIIAEGLGTLEESTTWGGADAQAETDGLRSSTTTWLADDSIAPLLETLTERVSGMSGLPSGFMEKWQVRASWVQSLGAESGGRGGGVRVGGACARGRLLVATLVAVVVRRLADHPLRHAIWMRCSVIFSALAVLFIDLMDTLAVVDVRNSTVRAALQHVCLVRAVAVISLVATRFAPANAVEPPGLIFFCPSFWLMFLGRWRGTGLRVFLSCTRTTLRPSTGLSAAAASAPSSST